MFGSFYFSVGDTARDLEEEYERSAGLKVREGMIHYRPRLPGVLQTSSRQDPKLEAFHEGCCRMSEASQVVPFSLGTNEWDDLSHYNY